MNWGTRLRSLRASTSLIPAFVAVAGIYSATRIHELSADADGEKKCSSILDARGISAPLIQASVASARAEPEWAQRGGTINDASCLDRVPVHGIVAVHGADDIRRALAFARTNGLRVSAAGVRHSMGGQAFDAHGIVLDMRGFKRMSLDEKSRTLTVQSGATWHDIQQFLHPRFAVRSMQSTDIFTVGGSVSVNAHGMDHQAGAMANSIRAMRVMLADGSIEEVSRSRNRELFDLVVGGYGLFGVVLDVDLDVADNVIYAPGRRVVDYREFPKVFDEIAADRSIGLMYAHLSTAPSSYLRETLVYTYRQVEVDAGEMPPLGTVGSEGIRRLTMNLSKRNAMFKELKWLAEKRLEPLVDACPVSRAAAMASGEACLVTRNDPMHDSVAYLRNRLGDETDILHEYFVPRAQLVPFIDDLREVLLRRNANLLNASIRVVGKEDNVLTYAPQDSFSIVLYLNQSVDADGNRRMKELTNELIDVTLKHGGRFFLPYQLTYSADQLRSAYPNIADFFEAKRAFDPQDLFSNTFYRTYGAKPLASLPDAG